MSGERLYVIQLEVRVVGPEAEWDTVAERVREKVEGVKLGRIGRVAVVALDESEEGDR